jgi:hypothetical protein
MPKEIRFTPMYEIGQVVYDQTNNYKGFVIGYVIDKIETLYMVQFCTSEILTLYNFQIGETTFYE